MDNLEAIRQVSRMAGGLYYLSYLAQRVNGHPNPTAATWVAELEKMAGSIAAQIERMNENATAPPTPATINAAAPHPAGDKPDWPADTILRREG